MYNTKRNTKIFWSVFIVFATIYLYIAGIQTNKKWNKLYDYFNRANINDVLVKNDVYMKGVKIIFLNSEYVFYPRTSNLNDNNIFSYTAKQGDSIIKPAYSDTLILIKKNGEVLKYTFQKPNEE